MKPGHRRMLGATEYDLAVQADAMPMDELAEMRRAYASRVATLDVIMELWAKAEAGDGDAEADAMSTERLAALWQMPATKVRDWCRVGHIPAKKVGREWVIPRAALEEWLKAVGKGKVGR